MSLRTRAREVALQILFQDDLNKNRTTDDDLRFIRNRLHSQGNVIQFCQALVTGVRNKKAEIDSVLGSVAANWKIGRMPATDRNVLRLGAFEILFYDTPPAVAINEAIEIAKRYGNEQSSLFINGILDRLIQQGVEQVPMPTATEDSSPAVQPPSVDPSTDTTTSDEASNVAPLHQYRSGEDRKPSEPRMDREQNPPSSTSTDPSSGDPASTDPASTDPEPPDPEPSESSDKTSRVS